MLQCRFCATFRAISPFCRVVRVDVGHASAPSALFRRHDDDPTLPSWRLPFECSFRRAREFMAGGAPPLTAVAVPPSSAPDQANKRAIVPDLSLCTLGWGWPLSQFIRYISPLGRRAMDQRYSIITAPSLEPQTTNHPCTRIPFASLGARVCKYRRSCDGYRFGSRCSLPNHLDQILRGLEERNLHAAAPEAPPLVMS